MFYSHGGGFATGNGGAEPFPQNTSHDGASLAKSYDDVVVTHNHRLNLFGYLYLGDLLGEEYAASGGAGMLDIAAALAWVRKNAEAFGGAPDLRLATGAIPARIGHDMRSAAWFFLSVMTAMGQYSVERDGDVIRLLDGKARTVVSVMPSHGNSAFDMRVNGKKVLQFPYASPDEFKKARGMSGIPFLAPWANRLDTTGFYANGKKYTFNLGLGTVRGAPDSHPMHGFVTAATQWEVIAAAADLNSAWVTSRLEFYRQPDWMAQFPFAHTIEMTYRLQNGTLEVQTRLNNLSADPMPVAIGFHPYFQVNDAPRDEWTFGVAARTQWLLAPDKIPTGETRPIEQLLPTPRQSALKGLSLDDVFDNLIRDASGKATMWVQGKTERVEVAFGPNYHVVVVWAPPGPNRDFICFEPMAGITDALNLAQRGIYKELQSIPPGKTWQESFWVKPVGF